MCITTLSSNIHQVKAENLEAKSAQISVAVKTDDLENGVENPVFYATRYGMLYNPNEDFKPDIASGQKIKGPLVDSYWEQLPEARKEYKKRLAKYQTGRESGPASDDIEELRETIKNKDIRIKDQAQQISDLMKKGGNTSTEIEQLQSMVNTLKEIQGNRIEIVQRGKATKILEKVVHENFEKIIGLLSDGEAVYLHGPAGTGKSRLAEDIAEALDLDFYPVSTVTQEFKLAGFIDGNGVFHETNFYKAMKYGGLFFIDEMDSATTEVLVGINGALASGYYDFANETVYAHKNFRVIGAGNTIGRGADDIYTGRQVLDMSTLDRFWGVPIDYSPKIDNVVAHGDKELVDFAHEVRRASKDTGITIILSYRSLSRIADFQEKLSLVEIMQYAVIKGIDSDDVKMLARSMNLTTTNKYFKAFKEAC